MPNVGSLQPEIAAVSARLDQLREEMKATPIYCREGQRYQDMARERQKLLARLEALRTLERTS